MMNEAIINAFNESISVNKESAKLSSEIEKSANLIIDAFKKGKKLLICGNGGSAADSQHFAAEMVGRYKKDRRGLPAIALTTDTSIITAVANDYGFDAIFEKQVEALGEKGDILFAISTSGNSPNVLKAMEKAKTKGMNVIGLSGKNGGKMKGLCDIDLIVPSSNTPRIQESHITMIHIICELVEGGMFK
jgi:D-sedoheptulose 7-phosphate isomerase